MDPREIFANVYKKFLFNMHFTWGGGFIDFIFSKWFMTKKGGGEVGTTAFQN